MLGNIILNSTFSNCDLSPCGMQQMSVAGHARQSAWDNEEGGKDAVCRSALTLTYPDELDLRLGA